jgi:site-specific recombinase XerD
LYLIRAQGLEAFRLDLRQNQSYQGVRQSRETFRRVVNKPQSAFPRDRLGLPEDLVWYSARHTFATDLLDKTGNCALVQKILGHESIATTQRYLHPASKKIAKLVNERNIEHADEALRHSREQIQ